jgi:hypothetical protein
MTMSNTIETQTYCPQCGTGLITGFRFCQGCGKSSVEEQPPKQYQEHPPELPVPAVRTRVAWWDLALIVFGLWWSYTLVIAARHFAGYRYDDAAYLLGRHFSVVLFAAAIAYGIAGRKRSRNWHRFCLAGSAALILLPLLPFISAMGKSV